MGWKKLVREYFTFNQRERRSLYALLFLLSGLVVTHAVFRFSSTEALPLSTREKQEMAAFAASFKQEKAAPTSRYSEDVKVVPPASWSSFDPNTVPLEQLLATGLEASLANRLVKYRQKGGVYRNENDLAKLYGMDTAWLRQAMMYMTFETPSRQKTFQTHRSKTDSLPGRVRIPRARMELNTADSLQLASIPGIGPYYTREILKLRRSLHGFRSYSQLLEIYNMRDETLERLMDHTTLDTSMISCININTCSTDVLGRHPYLTWKQARVIVAYRKQHGPYGFVSDIQKTDVVPDSVFNKIAPYLCLD